MNFKLPSVLMKNSKTILRAATISGVVATGGFAIYGTINATKLIDRKYDIKDKRDRAELLKILAKCYWPMVVCGGLTIGATVYEGVLSDRDRLAYAAAMELAEDTLSKAKAKMIEKIGPDEAKKLMDEVHEERAAEKIKSAEKIPGKGPDLCYDAVTGQMFYSSINDIKSAQNIINERYNGQVRGPGLVCAGREVFLSEFTELLGERDFSLGNKYGWDPCVWVSTPPLSVDIRSTIIDGTPVLMVNYEVYSMDRRSEYYA